MLKQNSPAYNYYGEGRLYSQGLVSNFMSFYKWSYNNGYKKD